jgi:hypothetical protein
VNAELELGVPRVSGAFRAGRRLFAIVPGGGFFYNERFFCKVKEIRRLTPRFQKCAVSGRELAGLTQARPQT